MHDVQSRQHAVRMCYSAVGRSNFETSFNPVRMLSLFATQIRPESPAFDTCQWLRYDIARSLGAKAYRWA